MNLKEVLNKYNFRFKKQLGQNFITDPGILRKIADVAQIKEHDLVIEIGPGIGSLTRFLAERAEKVISIEIDRELMPILRDNLADLENIILVQGDALQIDLDQLVLERIGLSRSYKIVANLPYYITTPLIMHFLEQEFRIEQIVVMVQKEVAERIVARPGGKEYGALTVNLNNFAEARIAFSVSRQVFTPQPAVDSAVIDLKVKKEPQYPLSERKFLRKVITAAFGQRRKTLLNSLQTLGIEKRDLIIALGEAGIDGARRGETLSLEEFVSLTMSLYQRLEN